MEIRPIDWAFLKLILTAWTFSAKLNNMIMNRQRGSFVLRHRPIRLLLALVAFAFLLPINCEAQKLETSRYIRQDHRDSVIVFVHGLLGDSQATWTNPTTKAYWPMLMKNDPYFKDFDLFVVGYPTGFFNKSYTDTELIAVFRRELDAAGIFEKYKRVYFLCHSMGGVIVRAYLIEYPNKASQVPMIYFFSTPTGGAEIARLGKFLSLNRQMGKLIACKLNTFLV